MATNYILFIVIGGSGSSAPALVSTSSSGSPYPSRKDGIRK